MLVKKVSILSGKTHIRDIPVSDEQLAAWGGGMLIQQAMANVSADDREFLISGITPEEWNTTTEGTE